MRRERDPGIVRTGVEAQAAKVRKQKKRFLTSKTKRRCKIKETRQDWSRIIKSGIKN